MKSITISTENSETYSSISNFFIDYYMTKANGEYVKVYLYLVRLLSSNSVITVAQIADHFDLTENDICRAIRYWISQKVLKLNYDGNGNLCGIVLLPLESPKDDLKMSSDAVSILRADSVVEKKETSKQPAKEKAVTIKEAPTAVEFVSTPEKPRYTKDELENRRLHDSDIEDIVYVLETLFGKPSSQKELETILYIKDCLKFDTDLFEYLIDYCTTMGKKNCRYMEAVAIAWHKDNITTLAQAKEQNSLSKAISDSIFKYLGIRRAYPTNIELAYINTWSKDFAFSPEIIQRACEKAVATRPASANFAYINGILENWHKNNVKTLEDIDAMDKAFAEKKAVEAQLKRKGGSTKNGSFNTFTQDDMTAKMIEMESILLQEVNS